MNRLLTLVITILLASFAIAQTPPPDDKGNNASANAGPTSGFPDSMMVDGVRVYKVVNGVTAPRAIKAPNPDYSKEAHEKKYQGTCVLWLVVGTDGMTHNIRVQRPLGLGLDEKAIEAVKKWRFKPATKDGVPVASMINVEVTFKLY